MKRGFRVRLLESVAGPFRRHLFLKFVAATLGIGVLANTLVLGAFYQYRQSQVIGTAAAEIATIGNRIVRPIAGHVAAGQTRPAQDLLSVFAAFHYIICADVEAADGTVVASWPAIGCARIREQGETVRIAWPGDDTATIIVRYDQGRVLEALRREFLVLGGLALIGGLAIILPALVTFFWIINRPLSRLLGAIEAFKQHERAEWVDYASGDEIGRVIHSYNKMLELEVQRVAEVRDAHASILDSVTYASRIQRALLPSAERLAEPFADAAAIWQPRDGVGGDIFWISPPGPKTTLAVFDCTGHGVPGALLTMLAIASLERVIAETADPGPAQILGDLNRLMRRTLRQEAVTPAGDLDLGPVNNDGLDAAILQIDSKRGEAVFAGARLPLLLERRGKVTRLRGDRISLGYADSPPDHRFAATSLPLEPGLRFFIVTDGVTDQIGGARRRAFGHRRLTQILVDASGQELEAVLAAVLAAVDRHAAGEIRRDDLTMLAVEPGPA